MTLYRKKLRLQINSPITTVKKVPAPDGQADAEKTLTSKAAEGNELNPKPASAKSDQSASEASGKNLTLTDTDKLTESIEMCPEKWSKDDVAQFLQQKDCGAYIEGFLAKVRNPFNKLMEVSNVSDGSIA